MADGDNYGDLQQPVGGYPPTGGADASPGYGDYQYPASPYKNPPTTAPSTPPPPIDIPQVKTDLQNAGVSLQGVNLLDMDTHKNAKEFEAHPVEFVAWTESSTQIFVNVGRLQDIQDAVGLNNARALALIALRHEIVHVGQFKTINGPPGTFKDMIKFEADAYTKTVQFFDDPNTSKFLTKIGATKNFLKTLRDDAAASKKKFVAQQKESDEDKNKAWLIKNEFLPPSIGGNANYAVPDLY